MDALLSFCGAFPCMRDVVTNALKFLAACKDNDADRFPSLSSCIGLYGLDDDDDGDPGELLS